MGNKEESKMSKSITKKTIGELSKFLGVSVHTIKYYEKQGLISSVRDEKSNYRYYDIHVCTDLYECVKYRNMGFSVKDSQILLREADTNKVDDMVKVRLQEVDAQIEELIDIRKNISDYYEEISSINDKLGQWYIEPMETTYVYYQTDDLEYKTENSIGSSSVDFLRYFPKTKSVLHVPKESLDGGEFKYKWGLSLKEHEMPTNIDKSLLEKIDFRRVFVTYHKYDVPYTKYFDVVLEGLRKMLKQYNLESKDDAYFFRIKNAHEGDKEVEYFKVCIPI